MWVDLNAETQEPRTPETQPQASRCLPPRVPPAPPGTSDAFGAPDDPRRATAGLVSMLQQCIGDADRIADVLKDLETLPETERRARYFRSLVDCGKTLIGSRLEQLRSRVAPQSDRLFDTDLPLFKREWLRFCAAGKARPQLDKALDTIVFTAVARVQVIGAERLPDALYHYPLPPYYSRATLGLLPPGRVMQTILDDLRNVVAQEGNYRSGHVFHREIVQRLLALLFLVRLATPRQPRRLPDVSTEWIAAPCPWDEDPEEQRLRQWERPSD